MRVLVQFIILGDQCCVANSLKLFGDIVQFSFFGRLDFFGEITVHVFNDFVHQVFVIAKPFAQNIEERVYIVIVLSDQTPKVSHLLLFFNASLMGR